MKKQIAGSVLLFFIVVGILMAVNKPLTATTDPSEIVDYLLDAGIDFPENKTDSELLKHRKLVISSDINALSAQKTVKSLLLLNAIDTTTPIDLYIRTQGGWISDAFAIIDIMESIDAPVNTHAIGSTQSAGAMILAAGTGVRYGHPFASIMFHAGRYDNDGEYGEDQLDNDRILDFWKMHARIPKTWLMEEDDELVFLTPKKALEWGIIDEIKTNSSPPSEPIKVTGANETIN